MDKQIDSQKTLEVIERLKLAKVGDYEKWEVIIKKIKKNIPMNSRELEYYTNLTRIYKDSNISNRTKIYHTKLSEHDEKPPCQQCGENSQYYCNINDQYFCMTHIVGHDPNEF